VLLDPVDREWVFTNAHGVQLRRKVAAELTRDRIMKLQATDHREGAPGASGKTQCWD